MISIRINGKIEKNKFFIKFVVINFDDDSMKIIKRKANE